MQRNSEAFRGHTTAQQEHKRAKARKQKRERERKRGQKLPKTIQKTNMEETSLAVVLHVIIFLWASIKNEINKIRPQTKDNKTTG